MWKAWKLLEILVFQLIVLAKLSIQDDDVLPCHFHESVNITDGFEHENGSISHNGHLFHIGSYWYSDQVYLHDSTIETVEEHLRGCVCGLETSKPCVPFCCPENYLKRGDSYLMCEKYNHKLIVNSSNVEGYHEIDVMEDYTPIHRVCETYELPSEDVDFWKLQKVITHFAINIS